MSQSGNLYADLSVYYDQFCTNIDYAAQCAFARRAFGVFAEVSGRDYLDLACGTGQHLLDMLQHGFTGSGLDNSPAMLAQAASRCPGAELHLCDLAEFEHSNAFDLITCFLYSLHYSHPTTAVSETLRRAYTALKPGGVFLFNAVDAAGIRNDAGITTEAQAHEGALQFQSAWHYPGQGEVLDLHLRITLTNNDERTQWQDHHTMTALQFPQLQQLLRSCGFNVQVLEHDYSLLQPWNGTSHNAIFVATKPAGN